MLFRKKPVVVEVRQLTSLNIGEIMEWCGSTEFLFENNLSWGKVLGIIVPTLEGQHQAIFTDWIIQGVRGEFYPCKDGIFQETYEQAEA